MSLEQIGRRVDRHPSTVSYWLAKHGLEAGGSRRHAPRGGIAEEELAKLVSAGLTQREMATRLEMSQTNVRYWLRRYGLPSATAQSNARFSAELAAGATSVEAECGRHGLVRYRRSGKGFRCPHCRSEAVARKRRRVKAELLEAAGGSCTLCGYDGAPRALHFHHLNPAEKRFGIAEGGLTRSMRELKAELRKCVLLCSNCHAEVEDGIRDPPVK